MRVNSAINFFLWAADTTWAAFRWHELPHREQGMLILYQINKIRDEVNVARIGQKKIRVCLHGWDGEVS